MFKGFYRGNTQIHSPDLKAVLERAFVHGVNRIMVTAGSLSEVRQAVDLVQEFQNHPNIPQLATTVGVHPTRCTEFEDYPKGGPETYLEELRQLAQQHCKLKIVAIGEFGLDYDRIHFCSPAIQRKYFEAQFVLADDTGLPLFLHMRDAAADFIEIIRRNRHRFKMGVVHSFTGSAEEARELVDLDLFIGVNGCSLKTVENLQVVKGIPLERIMVESDAPWCEIRPSHAGSAHIATKLVAVAKEKHDPAKAVKSRNEPVASRQVLECLASLHKQPLEEIAKLIYETSCRVISFP